MSQLKKFAPIGGVAGVIGYLCWPYYDDPSNRPDTNRPVKEARVTAALLSPDAALQLSRDPFASAADSNVSAAPGSAAGKPSAPSKAAVAPITGPPSTMILNGTYVRGNQRIAVINGALYAQGEQIPPEDASVENCSVVRVDVDKVVLNFNGAPAELRYTNLAAWEPSIASQSTAPKARPGSAVRDASSSTH